MFFFVNNLQKTLYKIKLENFGLSSIALNTTAKKLGVSRLWRTSNPFSKQLKNPYILFLITKIEYDLRELIAFKSRFFNSELKKLTFKRIRLLKLNRTLRGVRHSQFLPVHGQRTKTNAKTQKLKRKK
jgi:ribosomal protein S13